MYTSFHISPHSQLIKALIGPFTVVSFNRCNSLTRLIVYFTIMVALKIFDLF